MFLDVPKNSRSSFSQVEENDTVEKLGKKDSIDRIGQKLGASAPGIGLTFMFWFWDDSTLSHLIFFFFFFFFFCIFKGFRVCFLMFWVGLRYRKTILSFLSLYFHFFKLDVLVIMFRVLLDYLKAIFSVVVGTFINFYQILWNFIDFSIIPSNSNLFSSQLNVFLLDLILTHARCVKISQKLTIKRTYFEIINRFQWGIKKGN